MKKLLLLFLFSFIVIFSFAQFPNSQQQGSATTLNTFLGALKGAKGLINGIYVDTLEANAGNIDFYPGAQIFTTSDNSIWIRDATATSWIKGNENVLVPQCGLGSGGIVTWDSLLVFDVSAATWISCCDNIPRQTSFTVITLAAAHASLSRIDAIVLDPTSGVLVVQGTPAGVASIPNISPCQIFLTAVLIQPAATVPSSVGKLTVYDENNGGEWIPATVTGVTADFVNTTSPAHLLKAVHWESGVTGEREIVFNAPSVININDYGILKLYIKLTTGIFGGYLMVDFPGSTSFGIPLSSFGFNPTSAVGYQIISIPLTAFTFTNPTTVDKFRILVKGTTTAALDFYVDWIQFQSDINTPSSVNGITNINTTGNHLFTPLVTYPFSNTANIAFPLDGFLPVNLLDTADGNDGDFIKKINGIWTPVSDSTAIDTIYVVNGLHVNSGSERDTILWGGTLNANTTVDNGIFQSNFTGTFASGPIFQVSNTGSGNGFLGTSISGYGVRATSGSGNALSTLATTGFGAVIGINPSSTNTVAEIMQIQRLSSGTAAAGEGLSIGLYNQGTLGVALLSNQIISKLTTATSGSQVSQLSFTGVDVAATKTLQTLDGNGQITFNQYTTSNFNGGVAADSVLVITSAGVVKKRNGASVGSTPNLQQVTSVDSVTTHDIFVNSYRIGRGVTNDVTNFVAGFESGQNFRDTAEHNTVVGYQALKFNTGGREQTAFGYGALSNYTTIPGELIENGLNTAIGSEALINLIDGINVVALGQKAGLNLKHGPASIFIGNHAGSSLFYSHHNVIIGDGAVSDAATTTDSAFNNVLIGDLVASKPGTKSYNTILGFWAGRTLRKGVGNTSVGSIANELLDSASYNTSFGYGAGTATTTGNYNLSLGVYASGLTTTGSNNIVIGNNINLPSNTGSNQLTIGNLIFGTGVTGTGTTAAGKIGILNNNPSEVLDVTGNGKFTGTITSPALIGGTGTTQTLTLQTTSGSGTTGSDIIFTDDNTELMRILNSGSVGIGTSAPLSKLHIRNSNTGITPVTNSHLTVENNNGNSYIQMLSNNASEDGIIFGNQSTNFGGGLIYYNANKNMQFKVNGDNVRMIIDSFGRVGIGTSTPDYLIDLDNTLVSPKIAVYNDAVDVMGFGAASGEFRIFGAAAGTSRIVFGKQSISTFTEQATITNAGKLGIGTGASPDSMLTVLQGISGQRGVRFSGIPNSATRYVVHMDSNGTLSYADSTAGGPVVVANGDLVAQTTTQNIVTYTTPNSATLGVYHISADVVVTAVAAGVLTTTCTYTDETGASRTVTFYSMGTTTAGLSVTGVSNFAVMGEIVPLFNTAITVTCTLTVGTATYSAHGTIIRVRNYTPA